MITFFAVFDKKKETLYRKIVRKKNVRITSLCP